MPQHGPQLAGSGIPYPCRSVGASGYDPLPIGTELRAKDHAIVLQSEQCPAGRDLPYPGCFVRGGRYDFRVVGAKSRAVHRSFVPERLGQRDPECPQAHRREHPIRDHAVGGALSQEFGKHRQPPPGLARLQGLFGPKPFRLLQVLCQLLVRLLRFAFLLKRVGSQQHQAGNHGRCNGCGPRHAATVSCALPRGRQHLLAAQLVSPALEVSQVLGQLGRTGKALLGLAG